MADTVYAALTTKQAKAKAIAAAESVEDLDAMWAAWQAQGWSRDGLLYASVLERRAALGAELTEEETLMVELARKRREHGRRLPKITGGMRPGRGRGEG